jgi:hypothetical protein
MFEHFLIRNFFQISKIWESSKFKNLESVQNVKDFEKFNPQVYA